MARFMVTATVELEAADEEQAEEVVRSALWTHFGRWVEVEDVMQLDSGRETS